MYVASFTQLCHLQSLATYVGDLVEAPGFCLAQPGHCGHLGNEPANGRPLSLALAVCLKLCLSLHNSPKLIKKLKKYTFY